MVFRWSLFVVVGVVAIGYGVPTGVRISTPVGLLDKRLADQVERMVRRDPAELVCDRLLREKVLARWSADQHENSKLFDYNLADPADLRSRMRDARAIKQLFAHARRQLDESGYNRDWYINVLRLVGLLDKSDDYDLLEKHYERRWPDFMRYMHECSCRLSRIDPVNYQIRPFIEQDIVEKVKERFSPDQLLIITDFASGCLFEQFVLLNKLFDAGYKHIRVNLIDTAYAPLIERYAEHINPGVDGAYAIDPDTVYLTIDDEKRLYHMITLLDSAMQRGKFLNVDELSDLPNLVDLVNYNRVFVSFLQWFAYRGVDLEVVLYPSAAAYIGDIARQESSKAHVLMAIDYMIPLYAQLLPLFNRLRSETLVSGGYAISVFSVKPDGDAQWRTVLAKGNSSDIEYGELTGGALVQTFPVSKPVQAELEKAFLLAGAL